MHKYKNVAILFGRKGSQGFPGKNIYPVLGRPAALYPILAAFNSKKTNKIYLSTDDLKLKKLSLKYGVEILERPEKYCTSEALIEEVIQFTYRQLVEDLKIRTKYVTILLCNSCNVLAKLIDDATIFLDSNNNFDSVVTASKLNMYSPLRARKIDENGMLVPAVPLELVGKIKGFNSNRNSSGDVFFADGGMTVVRSDFLFDIKKNLLPFRWMGNKIHMFEQYPGGSDIDDFWQVSAMEAWLKKNGFTKKKTPYR